MIPELVISPMPLWRSASNQPPGVNLRIPRTGQITMADFKLPQRFTGHDSPYPAVFSAHVY